MGADLFFKEPILWVIMENETWSLGFLFVFFFVVFVDDDKIKLVAS